MNTEHPFYGFTPERHAEIDAQLEHMQSELAAILVEYRTVCANTNRYGYTATTMETAQTSLRKVRLALQREQDPYGKRR